MDRAGAQAVKSLDLLTLDEARAECAFWRGEFGQQTDAEFERRLVEAFNLTPGQARIVAVLYAAKGRVLNKHQIIEAVWPSRSELARSNTVSALLSVAQARTGIRWATAVWGRGYVISHAGRSAIEEKVSEL